MFWSCYFLPAALRAVQSAEGPLLRAKFHQHRCNDKGIGGHRKLIFLLRFDQNSEYKCPARGVSLAPFSRNLHRLYHVSGCLSG